MTAAGHAAAYLDEFRKRAIAVAVFFVVTLVAALFASGLLVKLFLASSVEENVRLVTLNPYESMALFMHLAFFLAIALSLPFAVYQLIRFAGPSLLPHERRAAYLTPVLALTLFIIGAALGYLMTKEVIVPFLSGLADGIGIANTWSINQYMKFIVYLSLATGLLFQMPLVIFMLVRFRILEPQQIAKGRKHVIVALLVIAAIITPPDFFSLLIMVVPLIALFELTLAISRFIRPRKAT